MVPGIVSCTAAEFEAENPVEETFLQPPAALSKPSPPGSRRPASSRGLAKP
jgi:hypothetical protein